MAKNSTVICNQCGSNEIDFVSEDYGICRYCRSKVFYRAYSQNVTYDNSSGIKTQAKIIKNKYTKEDFLRNVYISLAKDKDTAANILGSEFGDVKRKYYQLIGVTAKVSIFYSADIGYDRQEKYTAKERHYSSKAKRYYTRNVTRTRTVTDWKPQSGNYGGEFTEYADNSGKNELDVSDCKRFKDEMKSTSDNFILSADNSVGLMTAYPEKPTDGALKLVKQYLADTAIASCKNSLSGDRYRNFKANVTIKILSIDCIIAPAYAIEFKHNNKRRGREAFAIGAMRVAGKHDDENGMKRKLTVAFYSVTAFAILLLIASIAVSIATVNNAAIVWTFVIAGFISVATEIILPFIFKWGYRFAQKRKLSDLDKILKKSDLRELDFDEIGDIRQ